MIAAIAVGILVLLIVSLTGRLPLGSPPVPLDIVLFVLLLVSIILLIITLVTGGQSLFVWPSLHH